MLVNQVIYDGLTKEISGGFIRKYCMVLLTYLPPMENACLTSIPPRGMQKTYNNKICLY